MTEAILRVLLGSLGKNILFSPCKCYKDSNPVFPWHPACSHESSLLGTNITHAWSWTELKKSQSNWPGALIKPCWKLTLQLDFQVREPINSLYHLKHFEFNWLFFYSVTAKCILTNTHGYLTNILNDNDIRHNTKQKTKVN